MPVIDWIAAKALEVVSRAFHIDDIFDDWWNEDDEYLLD